MAFPQRWRAFSLSLIAHIGVIGLVNWIDVAFAPPPSPHYAVLDVPDQARPDKKVVWYNLRKAVPEIRPDRRFGPSDTPHGLKDPNRTLIAISPHPVSTHQVIRQPDQPKPLPKDVPAPNLVSIAVKLPPKVFVPPTVVPDRPKTAATTVIDAPPALNVPKTQTGNALGAIVSLQKLPPKVFVAPAVSGANAKAARQIAAPDPSVLEGQSSAMPGLQAVIIGLNPGNGLPPPGSRDGQIARAPEAGTPSSGVISSSGTVVPGLLSHGKPGETGAVTVPPPMPAIVSPKPQEILLPRVNRTMSAPLRPSSRLIPATVEARFANRNVYTLVIPGPALPGYGGDWVLWFAEHDPSQIESRSLISAPLPARKYPIPGGDSYLGLPATADLQFAAMIDKTGHVRSAAVLRGSPDPALWRRALDELGSWEFKSALRNGEPMDVDIVIDIPFRFQSAGATPH
jgi:hypothetical protein